jgi:rhodanese-related sulfurtransferase
MQHSEGFLAVVEAARPNVNEINIKQAREQLANNPNAILMDVREDREWENGHTIEAIHLSKGVLERDIESVVPDKNLEVIMYCGGGYRSVLTAETAQRMGYTNVHSLVGGYKALIAAEWQMELKD